MSVLLPGRDLTSQRAELYVAVLALKLTHVSVALLNDCASVVDRATSLKQHGHRCEDVVNFDNQDLRTVFLKGFTKNRTATCVAMSFRSVCETEST